jgi:hypothetical protein
VVSSGQRGGACFPALASFKRSKGLADDSVLDAATTAALTQAYGI